MKIAKISLYKLSSIVFLLSGTILLCECNTNSNYNNQRDNSTSRFELDIKKDSVHLILSTIIDISANDFIANQRPLPVAFRNVQFKYYIKPTKEVLYILCGEFATQENGTDVTWVHFSTIKNSDYEQWIGSNSLTYCENSTKISCDMDLSVALLSRLKSKQRPLHSHHQN